MALNYKILSLITILPYQISMLVLIIGFNVEDNAKPIIGKTIKNMIGFLVVVFFLFGVVVSLLSLLGFEEIESSHWRRSIYRQYFWRSWGTSSDQNR